MTHFIRPVLIGRGPAGLNPARGLGDACAFRPAGERRGARDGVVPLPQIWVGTGCGAGTQGAA